MSKPNNSIRALARSHTSIAIKILAKVMQSEDATPAARVSAANAILDRGWGKATQLGESSNNTAPDNIKIERAIVDPENTDGSGL